MSTTKQTRTVRHKSGRPKDLEKQDAILEAAGVHFLKHGFELTSMDAVARDADVSKITIYSHFADKQALFKAVIQEKCYRYSRSHNYSALIDKSPREALEEIGKNFIVLITDEEVIAMHRVIEFESLRSPKLAALFYEAGPSIVKSSFHELLEAWIKRGLLHIDDYPLAIDHFFSLLKGEFQMRMILNLQAKPTLPQIKRHVASVVKMFLSRYGTVAQAS